MNKLIKKVSMGLISHYNLHVREVHVRLAIFSKNSQKRRRLMAPGIGKGMVDVDVLSFVASFRR